MSEEAAKEGPTTSISEVKLSPQDVCGLLGGADLGHLAVDDETERRAREGDGQLMGRWRRRALGKLRPTGLLDDAGEPVRALRDMLEVLAGPGVVLMNGRPGLPEREGGATFEVCVAHGEACALWRSGTLRTRWHIMPFGKRERWEGCLRILRPFPARHVASRFDQRIVVADDHDSEVLSAVQLGDYDYLHGVAAAHHFDQEPLYDLARHVAAGSGRWPLPMVRFFARDTTPRDDAPDGVPAREKDMSMWPGLGCVIACERIPAPGTTAQEWQSEEVRREASFTRVDFVPTRDILSVLLAFDERPADEPDGQRKRHGRGGRHHDA